MSDAAFTTLFNQLSALGRFALNRMDDGRWHASVKFPAPEGVTAEVDSGFRNKTALEALQTLHDRLGGLTDMITVVTPRPGIGYRQIEA